MGVVDVLSVILALPNNDPAPGKDSQKQKGEPPEQDSQISWAQILPGVLVLLAYYMTSNVETLEVSFPYFLQHMLSTGEVWTCFKIPLSSASCHPLVML